MKLIAAFAEVLLLPMLPLVAPAPRAIVVTTARLPARSSVAAVPVSPSVNAFNVLLPPMVSVPTLTATLPMPLMGPVVTVAGELKTRVASFVTLPVPMVAGVTPSPTCKVPPLTKMGPGSVLVVRSVKVLMLLLVRFPKAILPGPLKV